MSDSITAKDLITVKCKDHGEFQVSAKDHLDGQGCPKCKPDQ